MNVYTPNFCFVNSRIEYRIHEWDNDFRKFLATLESKKPVILGGDMNVAHKSMDLARERHPGAEHN